MSLAKDSTLKAGVTVRSAPGHVSVIDSQYHPGGQGNNIYQLLRVIRNGAPHLVGSVSKSNGSIVDFTTGEVLYDFSQFGGTPRLGNDSYGCACAWTNPADGITRYYFGGWIKSPANVPVSGQQDHTNKYSYIIETADFVTWRIVMSDKAQAADSWQAEISALVPTNNALYFFRSDAQVGSAADGTNAGMGIGVFKYTGGATAISPAQAGPLGGGHVTRINTIGGISGTLYMDEVVYKSSFATPTMARINPVDDTAGANFDITNKPIAGRPGSAKTEPGTLVGNFGSLGGVLIWGAANGYWLGDPFRDGAFRFVPLLITNNDSNQFTRVCAWRSPVKQVAGGVVFAANLEAGSTDAANSFLVWVGHSGTIKILDVGGSFGAIEVYDDKLYYGVSSNHHAGPITNYKLDNPMLASIPIDRIKSATPPPFAENLKFSSYAVGTGVGPFGAWVGGYPTLGYRSGRLWLKSSAAGNLTITSINPGKSLITDGSSGNANMGYTAIAFTAGEKKSIDLAPYLDGGLLGFEFSAATVLEGRITMQP